MKYVLLALCFIPLISNAQLVVYLPYLGQPNYNQQSSPYRATINGNGGALQCSGSIIHERWILTSASCFPFGQIQGGLTANVGPYNYGVEYAAAHPNYPTSNLENDIALLRLNADLAFTNEIQRTPLDFNDNNDYRGSTAYLNSNGDPLQIVDESYCSGYTSNAQKLICAIHQSNQNCLVIPGTPIILLNRQIGLEMGLNQCNNQAQMFTRVSRHADWINGQLAIYGNQLLL